MTSIQPLIMCGGAGTRLWPTSRDTLPKQFSPLLGDRSTFQETVLRVQGPDFADRPMIITNRSHRFLVEQQLADIDVKADILLEPIRRDSGPAIASGCAAIARKRPDTPVLVVAADHMVSDVSAFRSAVVAGLPAAHAGRLVTFGIAPTRPATEYGYIELGEQAEGAAFAVAKFAEKPDALTAVRYILAGFVWNSGNFLFTAQTLLDEYARLSPGTVAAVRDAVESGRHEGGAFALDEKALEGAEKQSIDYAVFEHTSRAAVVKMSCGWSDIGNWDVLWSLGDQDEGGNVRRGDVELIDTNGCFVSTDGPLTSLLGVSDLVVVANRDAILVADRRRSPEVKRVVEVLRTKGRSEADSHSRVFRPWGWYQVIDGGDQFQVKRIVVNPSGRLSLQKHKHRAEHWVVVSGLAQVTVDDNVQRLGPNEHAHIPLGAVHRLENPGNTPVELIEVQSGAYLGEDDIVRLEDVYYRA